MLIYDPRTTFLLLLIELITRRLLSSTLPYAPVSSTQITLYLTNCDHTFKGSNSLHMEHVFTVYFEFLDTNLRKTDSVQLLGSMTVAFVQNWTDSSPFQS